VQMYFSTIGQPLTVPIYNVLLGVDGRCVGTPDTGGCDDGEDGIDIEQAISMAPNLSALLVYESTDSTTLASFTQAADDNVARELSISFGPSDGYSSAYEQVFMELAAQGQSIFAASGDAGAGVGDDTGVGASPNVTNVGGTDLVTSGPGGAWQYESGWIGSGGGWATNIPIPGFQSPAISSASQGSTQFRNFPDVAMHADTNSYLCGNEGCGTVGGTSVAAPRWAG
jgi:subtilase family serine protease